MIQDHAQCGSAVTKAVHLTGIVAQQWQQQRAIPRHRLHVKCHLRLGQVRLFQTAGKQLQPLRPRQVAKRRGRNPNPWRDVLEEIRHGPAAGRGKITHTVIHILENIRQLILLNPNRARAGCPALKHLRRSVRDPGEVIDLLRVRRHPNCQTCQGRGRRCRNRRNRHELLAHLPQRHIHALRTALELRAIQPKVHPQAPNHR